MTWTVPVPEDIPLDLAGPYVRVMADIHRQAQGEDMAVSCRHYSREWGWPDHKRVTRFLAQWHGVAIAGGRFEALDDRYREMRGYQIGGAQTEKTTAPPMPQQRPTHAPPMPQQNTDTPTVSDGQCPTHAPAAPHPCPANAPPSYKVEKENKNKNLQCFAREEGPLIDFALECCRMVNPCIKGSAIAGWIAAAGSRQAFAEAWDALRVHELRLERNPIGLLYRAFKDLADPDSDKGWIYKPGRQKGSGIVANPDLGWMRPILVDHARASQTRSGSAGPVPVSRDPEFWLWWFSLDSEPYTSALNGKRLEILVAIAAGGQPQVAEWASEIEGELRDLNADDPEYLASEVFRRDVAVRVAKRVGWVLPEIEPVMI